ncbi:hypothetical protein BJX62DRAFT_217425 [Aspergillus germanicus]
MVAAAAAANTLIQIPMVDAPYNIELQVYSKPDCIDLAGDQSNETIICEETPSSFQPIPDAHLHTLLTAGSTLSASQLRSGGCQSYPPNRIIRITSA